MSSLQIESSSISHPGLKRSTNEDAISFFEPETPDELRLSGCLYIIADGVGGAAFGERASRYAADKVKFEYFQRPQIEPAERLVQAMEMANQDIFVHSQSLGTQVRMATTLVAAAIRGNNLTVAWVGDSRAYLIRGGTPLQITSDHTTVGEMVKNGLMSEAEAQNSTAKNRLTRSLGGDDVVYVDVSPAISLQAGDILLLCTDGLTRYATGQEIAHLIGQETPDEAVCRLVDYANQKGGIDNVSVIMVRLKPAAASDLLVTAGTEHGENPYPVDLDLLETGGQNSKSRVPPTIKIRTNPRLLVAPAGAKRAPYQSRRYQNAWQRQAARWGMPWLADAPPDILRYGLMGVVFLVVVFGCLFRMLVWGGKQAAAPVAMANTVSPAPMFTIALNEQATIDALKVKETATASASKAQQEISVKETVASIMLSQTPAQLPASTPGAMPLVTAPPAGITSVPVQIGTTPLPGVLPTVIVCLHKIHPDEYLSTIIPQYKEKDSYNVYSCEEIGGVPNCGKAPATTIKGPEYSFTKEIWDGKWLEIPRDFITSQQDCAFYGGQLVNIVP